MHNKYHVLLPVIVVLSGCNSIRNNDRNKMQIASINKNDTLEHKTSNKKLQVTLQVTSSNNQLVGEKKQIEQYNIGHSVQLLLPDDLVNYMNGALRNNKQIIERQHELLGDHEQYNMAKSAFMPIITAEGSLSNSGTVYSKERDEAKQGKERILSKTESRSPAIKLEAKYNLFKGGADIAQLKQVDKEIESKWKSYDALVQKTLQETAQYYFEIIAKQKEIESIRALLQARKDSLRIVTDMEKAGNAKEVDVAQALAGYYDAEAKLSKAQAEENIYKAVLEEHTGIPYTKKLVSADSLFNRKFNLEEASNIATTHNPQIIAAQSQCEAAKYSLNASNAEFAPSIDVIAGVTHRGLHEQVYPEYSKNRKISEEKKLIQTYPEIKVVGTLPIFNGGSSLSKRIKASELVAKAVVTKDRIFNDVRKEIIKTLELETAANENILSANKSIEVQSLVLKATKEEYKAGTKMTNDVLEAQQKLFDAQLALISAVKERYIQQCNLMALLGLFNPKKLRLKESFDYKIEFNKQKRRVVPTYKELGVM